MNLSCNQCCTYWWCNIKFFKFAQKHSDHMHTCMDMHGHSHTHAHTQCSHTWMHTHCRQQHSFTLQVVNMRVSELGHTMCTDVCLVRSIQNQITLCDQAWQQDNMQAKSQINKYTIPYTDIRSWIQFQLLITHISYWIGLLPVLMWGKWRGGRCWITCLTIRWNVYDLITQNSMCWEDRDIFSKMEVWSQLQLLKNCCTDEHKN